VFDELRARGVSVAEITLHVGYGTFAPVRDEDLSKHSVAPESFEIVEEAAEEINETRARGGRIVAVGTTTVRALESAADERGRVRAGRGEAALTVTPGYEFRAVGARPCAAVDRCSLFTIDHLPFTIYLSWLC